MQTAANVFKTVEETIKKNPERFYFWTHSVRYQYILERIEELSKGRKLRVLDIGCFPYHIGYALELLGHDVFGISSHHEPITNKNIAILNIESEQFPYKDNYFDLVLCNEVLEHMPQSPIPPLLEMHRVTKKKGSLMITTPNIARSINRAKMLFGKTIMYPINVYFDRGGKGNNIYHRHNREYTLEELTTLVKKTSWQTVKKDYVISYTPFRKRDMTDSFFLVALKVTNYVLMLAIPPLRDTLFILGEK